MLFYNQKNKGCKDNPNCYYKQLQRLKAEKQRLEDDFAVEIQARLYHLSKHAKYAELSEKYRQALEEIEKIALRYVEAQGRREILTIINEVTGIENER